uniref:N-acetyltransferase domain-containing protein n=1 Tax=Parastrongyloides trichosuri TaxID=131310 RepID=A0A0N4ZQU9_PARTI
MFRRNIQTQIKITQGLMNPVPKLKTRITTIEDTEQILNVIKKGFHYDENLNKLFKLSFNEMLPIYKLILKNPFTINNSLVAVDQYDNIIGTFIILLKSKDPKFQHYFNESDDELMIELVKRNKKISTIFDIFYKSTEKVEKVLLNQFGSVYNSLILGILPEYRNQKVGTLLMSAREDKIFSKYKSIQADFGTCTTFKSRAILKNLGYHDCGHVSLTEYGAECLHDGTTHVIGIYKIFDNHTKLINLF